VNYLSPLGYVWIDGEWWNGIKRSVIKHGSIVWFCKKRMEWNGMVSIPSNTIHQANFSFHPIWGVSNRMERIKKQLQFCRYFYYYIRCLVLCLLTMSYFFLNFLFLVLFYYLLCYLLWFYSWSCRFGSPLNLLESYLKQYYLE